MDAIITLLGLVIGTIIFFAVMQNVKAIVYSCSSVCITFAFCWGIGIVLAWVAWKIAIIILYEQELKSVEGQIKNLSNAIAKGVCDDILVEKINTLSATKNDIKHRIESIKPKELPPIVESDVRQALTKFIDYMRENKEVECKAFLNKYIKKIIVYKDKVEVTFKVASSVFNADYPDDKSGALLINLAISRLDLKKLPKQRRRINKKGVFGDNYLIGYEITT